MALHPAPVPVVPERLRTAGMYSDCIRDEWGSDNEPCMPDPGLGCQPRRVHRINTVTEYSEWSFAEWSAAEWDPPVMHAVFPCIARPATAWPASEPARDPSLGSQIMLSDLLHVDQVKVGELRLDPATRLDAADLSTASPAAAEPAMAHEAKMQRDAQPKAASPGHQEPHWHQELQRRRGGRARRGIVTPNSEAPAADLLDSQRLQQLLQGSARDCLLALAELRGGAWALSCEKLGCRVVQDAIEKAPLAQATSLVKELHGHVREALASPHANFVIQRVIEKLPANESAFIAQELLADAKETAYHRFGCRIIIRLVEHTAANPSTAAVLKKILEEAVDMSCHRYGRHVILSILEQLETYRPQVVARIQHRARDMAKHRDGSYVIEKALQLCSTKDQDTLALALVGRGRDAVLDLARDGFACFVVRTLATMRATTTQQVLSRRVAGDVLSAQAELQASGVGGARLVRDLKTRLMARPPC